MPLQVRIWRFAPSSDCRMQVYIALHMQVSLHLQHREHRYGIPGFFGKSSFSEGSSLQF